MKSLLLLIYTLFALPSFAQSNCDFQMRWGHGDQVAPGLAKDIKAGKVCVGQGCYLELNHPETKSGNLKGLRPSIGTNGDWMEWLDPKYNSGLSPITPKNKREGNLLESQYTSKQLLKNSAIGFFRLTEHNWMTLLLSSMENSFLDLKKKSCSKVNIKFSCAYDDGKHRTRKAFHQREWAERMKEAPEARFNFNGKIIKVDLKQCAEVKNLHSGKLVSIFNVPKVCGEKYTFDTESLLKIFNGCKELFLKYSVDHYQKLASSLVTKSKEDTGYDQDRSVNEKGVDTTQPKTKAVKTQLIKSK